MEDEIYACDCPEPSKRISNESMHALTWEVGEDVCQDDLPTKTNEWQPAFI